MQVFRFRIDDLHLEGSGEGIHDVVLAPVIFDEFDIVGVSVVKDMEVNGAVLNIYRRIQSGIYNGYLEDIQTTNSGVLIIIWVDTSLNV